MRAARVDDRAALCMPGVIVSVDVRMLYEIASRYDTAMSMAMLRAIGRIGWSPSSEWQKRYRKRYSPSRREVIDCFFQRHSVEGM